MLGNINVLSSTSSDDVSFLQKQSSKQDPPTYSYQYHQLKMQASNYDGNESALKIRAHIAESAAGTYQTCAKSKRRRGGWS
jgi:hypothetical protein